MAYQDPLGSRRWYERNRAKVLDQVHAYYAANREKILAQKRAYRAAHRDKINARKRAAYARGETRPRNRAKDHDRLRLNRYGLTAADLATLRGRQGGLCAICARPLPLGVDHDHETGRVRGLLCRKCNSGLGQFDDDPNLLREAIRYLEAA